ncbi:hypothetical protein AX15_003329 [Amanita polypyramis BW_CC]|nr:hypothetical protein AX15_003329 [Amanita polypyramis BW_CC]
MGTLNLLMPLTKSNSVYERMLNNELVPSVSLNAKMLAAAISLSPEDVTLSGTFDRLFTNPLFTESTLLQTLQVMINLGTSHGVVVDVIEKFIESESEDYTPGKLVLAKLVEAQVRNDQLEDALGTLSHYEEATSAPGSDLVPNAIPQIPYVAIMSAIRDTASWNTTAVSRVLKIMQSNNIKPNVTLLNILISRAVRERSLYRAFSIYAILRMAGDSSQMKNQDGSVGVDLNMTPDAYTFGSLFNALYKYYDAEVKQRRIQESGDGGKPDVILSPRQLFFEMMKTYQSRSQLEQTNPSTSSLTPPFEPTPSLFNVALRSFIRTRDYAAAIILTASFRHLQLETTPKTYFIVFKHIMNRIRWDIKRVRMPGEGRWADRFLGVSPHGDIWTMDVDEKLARRVLEYATGSRFDVGKGVLEEEEKIREGGKSKSKSGNNNVHTKTFRTPTLEMMEGDEPIPPHARFSTVPLERLLQRALLADLSDPWRKGEFEVKDVSKEIRKAKEEMMPDIIIGMRRVNSNELIICTKDAHPYR